jgi:predicted RNase H-like HicB family nuclease/uncharacterized damage-inducible protein DinB
MKTYSLCVESGPKKQRTMVHVIDLLGCVAKGATTDEAIVNTPDAIRTYLKFLKRHGEPTPALVTAGASVDLGGEVKTKIIEHVMEGQWLGNGDPALVFQFDLKPITPKEIETYLQHLDWSRAEIVKLVSGLTHDQLEKEPGNKQRSIRIMLEHMLESEYFYLASFLDKIEELPATGSIVRKREGDVLSWMNHVRSIEVARLRALTPDERSKSIERWKQTWTARKMFRRMLEHEWEHLIELSERLGKVS